MSALHFFCVYRRWWNSQRSFLSRHTIIHDQERIWLFLSLCLECCCYKRMDREESGWKVYYLQGFLNTRWDSHNSFDMWFIMMSYVICNAWHGTLCSSLTINCCDAFGHQLFFDSVAFSLGLATTLAVLGIGASLAGKAYGQIGQGLPIAVSVVAMIMGLNLLEVGDLVPKT